MIANDSADNSAWIRRNGHISTANMRIVNVLPRPRRYQKGHETTGSRWLCRRSQSLPTIVHEVPMTQAASALAPSRPLLGWVDVATWLAFIATWLYTAGWSFAYHYFDRFHVGLLALEIPKEDYFLYSFWVLQDHWGWALVSYLMGMGYLVLRRYVAGAVWRRWETPVVNGLAPVLGATPGVEWVSARRGQCRQAFYRTTTVRLSGVFPCAGVDDRARQRSGASPRHAPTNAAISRLPGRWMLPATRAASRQGVYVQARTRGPIRQSLVVDPAAGVNPRLTSAAKQCKL